MLWEVFVCLLLISFILMGIYTLPFFKVKQITPKLLALAFLFKLAGGITIYLIYSYHYTDRSSADVFKYYDDALSIAEQGEWNITHFPELFDTQKDRSQTTNKLLENTQHWDQADLILPNDNRLMISINLLLLKVSADSYFFHLIFFSLLAFLGLVALLHFMQSLSMLPAKWLLIILFIPPSTCLWSSGILKESVFFFSFGFLVYGLQKLKGPKRKWSHMAVFLIGLALSFWIKTYLLVCALPALLAYTLRGVVKTRTNLICCGLFTSAILVFGHEFFLNSVNHQLARFTSLATETSANSYFEIESMDDLGDFILHIPVFVYNVWIRPIFYWQGGYFSWITVLESLTYLLIPFLLIRYRKKSQFDWTMVFMLASFVLIASLVIGSSIPVLGAILRYRSVLIPFYLLLLSTFVETSRFHQLSKK